MTVYADLLRYRELFANLFRRDFQAKYKGSLLGVLWSLLNPLVLLGVYLVVFGLIFPNKKIAHYPVYLLAGLSCWIFFSVSLQSASRSMVDSAELIKKVRFPRQLVAFSMVATQAVTFGLMLVILIVLSLVFVPDARTTVWAAIPLAVVFAAFVAGLALLVACLNVLFRDVEHVLTAALLPWFFLTPILWNASTLAGQGEESRHPGRGAAVGQSRSHRRSAAVRDAIWSGHLPRAAEVIYLLVAAVVALALGAFVFTRVDDRIAVEL